MQLIHSSKKKNAIISIIKKNFKKKFHRKLLDKIFRGNGQEVLGKSVMNSKSLNGVACISPTLSQFLFLISNTNNTNTNKNKQIQKLHAPTETLSMACHGTKSFTFLILSYHPGCPFQPSLFYRDFKRIIRVIYTLPLSLLFYNLLYYILAKKKVFSLLPHFSSSSSSRFFFHQVFDS